MKSLDIKIVTCHDVNNFGASLQAYALQTYLELQGHHVQIVDYKPRYHSTGYIKSGLKGGLRGVVKKIYSLIINQSHRERNRKFRQFTDSRLHLTPKYNYIQELMTSQMDADVFIAGSDQIWNSLYLIGRDPVFYLDFVKKGVRKVAYAPSLTIPENDRRVEYLYHKELPEFDFISVRENSSLPFIQKIGRSDAEVVCDPVLLLSVQEWDRLIPKHELVDGEYLLVYDFDNNQQIATIARIIAEKRKLKIINISIDTLRDLGHKRSDVGPEEFLSLIRGAAFVVSSSYHATLFSLMYHKPFCVVKRQLNINQRMEDFLDDCGLNERIVTEYSPSLLDDYDAQQVNKKMEAIILSSKGYLSRALSFDQQ